MSNFCKFKRGDIVETTYGTVGSVIITNKTKDSFDVRIKCTDGTTMTFDEGNLKFHNKELKRNTIKFEDLGDECPVCSTEFKVTRFGAKEWKDCLPCKKTAEDIVKEVNEDKSNSFDYSSVVDAWGIGSPF